MVSWLSGTDQASDDEAFDSLVDMWCNVMRALPPFTRWANVSTLLGGGLILC